jgi:hypothetical protein
LHGLILASKSHFDHLKFLQISGFSCKATLHLRDACTFQLWRRRHCFKFMLSAAANSGFTCWSIINPTQRHMQQLADELNGPVKSAIKASAYVVSNQIIFASFTGQVRTGACGDEQQSINEVSCHFSPELRPGSFRRILSLAGYGCDQGDVTCNISYHNRASALLALIPSFTGDWAIDLSVCFCWCRCTLLEENAKFKGTCTLDIR